MLKFNRKFKKLVIPVGINPSYNIDSSTLYNTIDATVNANDIVSGKVAYGSDGKIVGSLDINERVQESYNEGVQSQKSKLESITITENGTYSREDGYNEVVVDVPDLNGSYDEGYNEGVAVGREEIINEQSDATITPQTVFKGEIGYGKDGEKIVGDYESLDFKQLGYSDENIESANSMLSNSIDYSKQLLDKWDSNTTSAFELYVRDYKLTFAPKIDTSKVTDMRYMFRDCYGLTYVPQFDTSNVRNMSDMFYQCRTLTTVPIFDTNSVTDMSYMFYGCNSLTTIQLFDTINVRNMSNMFVNCSNLTTVPLFDTNSVTDMSYMFYGCSNLTTVPQFDTSNVTNMSYMFLECSNLTSVPEFNCSHINSLLYTNSPIKLFNYENNVSELGGFMHLGEGYTNILGSSNATLQLQDLSQLTHESCMNVINKVYDMNLNNAFTNTASIRFHATPYALLSQEDIAIATNKGWSVQAG